MVSIQTRSSVQCSNCLKKFSCEIMIEHGKLTMNDEGAYYAELPHHIWLSTRRCYLAREYLTDGGACKLVLNDRQPQVASSHQDRHLWVVLIRVLCRWIQVRWLSHTQKVRERIMWTRNSTFFVVLNFLGRFSGLFLCFLLRIRHLTCEMWSERR